MRWLGPGGRGHEMRRKRDEMSMEPLILENDSVEAATIMEADDVQRAFGIQCRALEMKGVQGVVEMHALEQEARQTCGRSISASRRLA